MTISPHSKAADGTGHDSGREGVGIFGLGIIGTEVARHLREAGWRVSVWNRTPKPEEAGWKATPAEVAREARILQLFVADPQAVDDVLDAIGDALTPEHLVICSATIGHEATLRVAQRVADAGARFLDAPFTGSKEASAAAKLLYYLGGEPAVIEEAMPVLRVSGGKGIVPIGDIGQAAIVKVATNVISAVTVEVLAEMFALAETAGVSPEQLVKAIEPHGIRSGLIDMKLPKMLAHDYETHFALKHMLKDVRFGTDLAAKHELELPATEAAVRAMEEGVEKGWADADFAIVRDLYR
ncbi:MAG TPA: NAD(P)-dependent oxidoreductase [Chthoniobacteraceae bacterium]|nr:NAD(P)-dependent oxidoreductase [Chthoniobacteraceae bacterium]